METLKISLPRELKSFVDEQRTTGSHKSPSAYFADLVQAERRRVAEQKLIKLMQEADESGSATPMTEQDWKDLRSRVRARLEKGKRPHGKNRLKSILIRDRESF